MKMNALLGKPDDENIYLPNNLLINSDKIGIEIELEAVSMTAPFFNKVFPAKYWRAVQEDSIRNGFEMVLKEPLCGEGLIKAIQAYDNFLNSWKRETGNYPVISERCSIHIHLDIRDIEVHQLSTLAIIYCMYEKILFQYLQPSRYRNNYCMGVTSTLFDAALDKFPKNISDREDYYRFSEYIISNHEKYGAINLLPSISFGSVEFRGHPGTFDISNLLTWINLLLSIKQFTREIDVLTPQFISSVTSLNFTTMIFKNISPILVNTHDFESNFEFGKSWAIEIINRRYLKNITNETLNKETSEATLFKTFTGES